MKTEYTAEFHKDCAHELAIEAQKYLEEYKASTDDGLKMVLKLKIAQLTERFLIAHKEAGYAQDPETLEMGEALNVLKKGISASFSL